MRSLIKLLSPRTIVAGGVPALALTAALAAPPALRVHHQIEVPGAASFGYPLLDSAAQRLYLPHGSQVEVLDTRSEKWIGRITDTPGVRGIAIAPDLGLGWTTNATADTVSVFDLATFQTRGTIAVGAKPDAILYDAPTHRVLVFNNQSQTMSVIDGGRGEVIATVALEGEPETAAFDSQGLVHINLEDSNEQLVIDPERVQVLQRRALGPCQRPVGLDIAQGRVAASCGNQWLMITQALDGRRLGAVRIGAGAEGVAWLDDTLYTANGLDGTLTVVGPAATAAPGDGYVALGTITTAGGSRRVVADPAMHRLYVPAMTQKRVEGSNRLQGVEGSLRLLVLQRP